MKKEGDDNKGGSRGKQIIRYAWELAARVASMEEAGNTRLKKSCFDRIVAVAVSNSFKTVNKFRVK